MFHLKDQVSDVTTDTYEGINFNFPKESFKVLGSVIFVKRNREY